MDVVSMDPKTAFLGKTSTAHVADKWFFSSMYPYVPSKICFAVKHLLTELTLIIMYLFSLLLWKLWNRKKGSYEVKTDWVIELDLTSH